MDMSISIILPEEQKYTYTQSWQIMSQTGCIGHLRADFGSGKEFYSSWDDHSADLKTPEFKRELDEVINTLRFGPVYVDKHNCIIQEHDKLRYDDGTVEEVFILEDRSMGHSIMNPDSLKLHPGTENKYVSLISSPLLHGVRELHNAEIAGLDDPSLRLNRAFVGTILESREKLSQFCFDSPLASFGNHQDWGIRINTPDYSYLMRLNPNKGLYSMYCYCYRRDWLDHHMKQAEKGIRFIKPNYEELFRLKDGDQLRILTSDGEKIDQTVRYVDDYHLEIGGFFGNNLYHICEFAEKMEQAGNKIIPLRSSLPENALSMWNPPMRSASWSAARWDTGPQASHPKMAFPSVRA